MEIKQGIEKISKMRESEIGPTEENVKQKIIVPLLELLGHNRENLEFEYRTRRGGKIDIFVKNVPPDCKVIVDTKNFNENLDDYIEQIKEYTFDEAALLTVIANGTEIRIYSPLHGVSFERSLLYSFKRQDLGKERVWKTLSDLLNYSNLRSRDVLVRIDQREREIKDAILEEERLSEEYKEKIEGIDKDIKEMQEQIEQLEKNKLSLTEESDRRISEIWSAIDLPQRLVGITGKGMDESHRKPDKTSTSGRKAKKVTFKELASAGLLRDGEILHLCYRGRVFKDEQAQVIVSSNKLKYRENGKVFSKSELARILLKKHAVIQHNAVRGPICWQTRDGKLLNELEEQIRRKTGE